MDVDAGERYFGGLRKLHLDATSGCTFAALRAVGPTLEEIVCFERWTRRHFEQVQKLCPKLSRIELTVEGDDDDDWAAYAGLLCSY